MEAGGVAEVDAGECGESGDGTQIGKRSKMFPWRRKRLWAPLFQRRASSVAQDGSGARMGVGDAGVCDEVGAEFGTEVGIDSETEFF